MPEAMGERVEKFEQVRNFGVAVSGWDCWGWCEMLKVLKVVFCGERAGGWEMWGFCGKGRRFGEGKVGFSLKGRRFVATHPWLVIGAAGLGGSVRC